MSTPTPAASSTTCAPWRLGPDESRALIARLADETS